MSALARRRSQRNTNIWPGFVDALATLLMVIIFLLMIFVLAQFFLGEALSGRDQALDRLQNQIAEMGDLLALERKSNQRLQTDFSLITEELQASIISRDDLNASLRLMSERSQAIETRAEDLTARLDDAFKTIDVNKETIASKLRELVILGADINALSALRQELEKEIHALSRILIDKESQLAAKDSRISGLNTQVSDRDKLISDRDKLISERDRLILEREMLIAEREAQISDRDKQLAGKNLLIADERKMSESALAQLALANRQMAALRDQLSSLAQALDVSEQKATEQGVQISALGKRLNSALASKVQELSRYRSEFFGRLRKVLGNQPGIRIVGDRFVFQSEVLFTSASSDLGEAGKTQLAQLATTLRELTRQIPADIDWILRIDGHTDSIPISNWKFASNWELSTSRAISVVKFLIDQRIPAHRLAATGFGQFRPLDTANDEIANRRNRRIELKLTQR